MASSLFPPPPSLPPISIPSSHPLAVTRSLTSLHPQAGPSSQPAITTAAPGSPSASTSASTLLSGATSAATPSSSSSLFLFDNTTSSPISPSFASTRLTRPSSQYRHHRSRSDSVSSTGSSSAGGHCVRRPTLSATSAFFASSFAMAAPPPPSASGPLGPPPTSPPLASGPFHARTPSPPPPAMVRRASLRPRRTSAGAGGGGSFPPSPRLTPSGTEDGFLFMGSAAPRAGSPSPLASPNLLLRRNSDDGGSINGRGNRDGSGREEPTIMEEDEGNAEGSTSGSGKSSKKPSKEELRESAIPTPVLSIKPPSSEDTLAGSTIFSPLSSALLVDADPDVLRSDTPSKRRKPGPEDARAKKVEERAAALEKRLDKLLLEMAASEGGRPGVDPLEAEIDEGMKSLGFGAVMFGGGGTSPMPTNKQLDEVSEDEDEDDEEHDGEEDDSVEAEELPIRYEPRHRSDWHRPQGILLFRVTTASLLDPLPLSSTSSRRPSSTLQLSRASSRSCGCLTCAATAPASSSALKRSEDGQAHGSPGTRSTAIEKSGSQASSLDSSGSGTESRGSSFEDGGGVRGWTAQTSPTMSEGKVLRESEEEGEAEEEGEGDATGKVRFCEAAAEEIVTWHATSYDRKGPPPVAKLTMRDVLELREIKEQLGVAVDLLGGGTSGGGLLSATSAYHSTGTTARPGQLFRVASGGASGSGSSDSSRVPTPSPTLPSAGWREGGKAWGGGGSLWC